MSSSRGVTAFFGTPDAAIPSLRALRAASEVRLVVTRPDKRRGRRSRLQPSAIKEAARKWDLPVAQPDKAVELVDDLAGTDLAVVVAYGQILPQALLDVPSCGFVNVHFSLLPRWRGAAPVARAILAGDSVTGVTLMQLDAGMDTGAIIAARQVPIEGGATTGSLTDRLSIEGAELLTEHLEAILSGTATRTPQGEDATLAKKIATVEARIDPRANSAVELERAVRAFNPKPGAWSLIDGERLKVWEAKLSQEELEPGALDVIDDSLHLGTVQGSLSLSVVQPAGGDRMGGVAWANGHRGSWRLD